MYCRFFLVCYAYWTYTCCALIHTVHLIQPIGCNINKRLCILLPTGIEIVRKALRIPCHTIAANAGVDAQEVVTQVMQEQTDVGYDALHGTFVDMMKAGIIDPTKVCLTVSMLAICILQRVLICRCC